MIFHIFQNKGVNLVLKNMYSIISVDCFKIKKNYKFTHATK